MFTLFVIESATHVLNNVAYFVIAAYAIWLAKTSKEMRIISFAASLFLISGYVTAVTIQHPPDQVTFFVNRVSALLSVWLAYYFINRYRLAQKLEQEQRKELEEKRVEEERLKSSLETYQAIASNFPAGWIGLLDESLCYEVAAGKGLDLLGIAQSSIVGKKFSALFGDDSILNIVKEAWTGKDVSFKASYSGRFYDIHAVQLPSNRKKKRLLAVVTDISTLKKAEIELIKALDKEREIGEMKSRFVSMASHEFRTPLAIIQSSASLLANYVSEKYEKEKRNHINKIKSSVRLLTDILDEFLSIGRLEGGIITPNYQMLNMSEFLQEIRNEIELIKGDLQKFTISQAGQHMVADPHFIKQILINLLSNALKFSGDHGQVELNMTTSENELTIMVRDNGIGILDEDQDHIFDQFFRGKNVENIQGTGLGLTIVKKYIGLLNGSITFRSSHSGLTEFVVKLPAGKELQI